MKQESNSRMGEILFHELLKRFSDTTLEVITHRGVTNETFGKILADYMGSGDVELYKQRVDSLKKEGVDVSMLDAEAVGLACIGFINVYLKLDITTREEYRQQYEDEESL